jgi:hypothetical protein
MKSNNFLFAGTAELLIGALCLVSLVSKAQVQIPDYTKQFRIEITANNTSMYDETMLYFEAGLPSYDSYDVVKPPFVTNGAPMIMTESVDGANLMMNSFGSVMQDIIIPLKVKAGTSGIHDLLFYDGPGFLEETCVRVEDVQTGAMTVIKEGDTLSLYLDANDPVNPARLRLHIGRSNNAGISDVSCFGMNDGEIAILGGSQGPWNYEWYGPGGVFLQSHIGHNGVSKLDNASAGIYRVDVTASGTCGIMSSYIEIESPPAITATFDILDQDCALPNSGAIEVIPNGLAPFNYVWGNGSNGAIATGLSAGDYSVYVFDSIGCSHYFPAINVGTMNGPEVEILASSNQVGVNEPVHFENMEQSFGTYAWDFGDGTTSSDVSPDHMFAIPGAYTVSLVVSDLDCSDTSYTEVQVGANGIRDVGPFSTVTANYISGYIELSGPEIILKRSSISVIDVRGAQVVPQRPVGYDRMIPVTNAAPGVYRVILSDEAGRRAIPVSIIQ